MTEQQLKGTDPITGRRYLLTLWGDGTGELAYRDDDHSTWSAPVDVAGSLVAAVTS